MAVKKISKEVDAYTLDSSSYYLGYRDADYQQQFAEYFDPNVEPISDEALRGIVSSIRATGPGETRSPV
ncbi:hypothetical protein BO83DRAFT_381370 [Aspergillus eucalypticola CBS 122712]|uniref:Uncharacterized protein n=1 Tax=Aspergillus eucalypticola (strain CBS 122712 / IBT 29274) TaxID=1448314 RepID=A0A317UY08_ASPEC|nr:uncharacterized protein BO83DRAFT_381370 [Aspergillus eucalypticola CBS 122712]PWY65392.1 hypothetical protein BO83DRAFT_381370 [Aspergillus eucalypticola CBS 122712]